MKRGIICLLVVSMMLSGMPVASFAQEGETLYEQIRRQYVEYLTGAGADETDAAYLEKVAFLDSEMDQWLSKDVFVPDGTENRMAVFADYPFRENIIDVNMMHTLYRMADMCKVLKTKGSKYYNDQTVIGEMIAALAFINDKWYNAENFSRFYPKGLYSGPSNWALMEFHIPRGITDVCVLLYDEMTSSENKELFDKLMKAIDTYTPQPDRASGGVDGANGTAISWAVMMRAVLMNNADGKFEKAAKFHADLIRYTNNANGFNEYDDSCPYHNNVAYTLGYGTDFYESCATYLYIMRGTAYDYFPEKKDFMVRVIKDSVSPLIYKSNGMTMVTGRYLGTEDYKKGTEENRAVHFASYAALVYDMLQGEEKTEIGRILRYHLDAFHENCPDAYMTMVTLPAHIIFEKMRKDDSLTGYTQDFDKTYPRMARVVHLRPEYGVGLAMMSKDTKAVEMAPENRKGWHTGSGMLYVYTSDIGHYAHTYKATVDYEHMPGTTVETGMHFGNNVFNRSNIANGAVLEDHYSAIAFQYNKPTSASGLVANKSYFMFDDEIVCIGSDISSTSSYNVETTVDNRMLSHDNSNTILIDGENKGQTFDETKQVSWAHMGGEKPGSDMGYYFPDDAQLHMTRKANTGKFSDICTEVGVSTEPITENFLTMYFQHGTKPQNATYQYVLLPTMSAADTEAYAKDPKVEIINNDNGIHAVKQKELGITAATFFGDNGGTTQDGFITSDKKASVLVREEADSYHVSIADVSRENAGTITVTLPLRDVVGTLDSDGIRTEVRGGIVILTADVSDRIGLSKTVTLLRSTEGMKDAKLEATFEDGEIPVTITEGAQSVDMEIAAMPGTDSNALKLTSKGASEDRTDFEDGTAGDFAVSGGAIVGDLPDGREGKAYKVDKKSLLKLDVAAPDKVSCYIYDPGPGTKLNAIIVAQEGSNSFQFGAFAAQAGGNYNSLNNYTFRCGSWYDSGVPRRKGWVKLEYTTGSLTEKPIVTIDGKTLDLPLEAASYPIKLNQVLIGDNWGANVDAVGYIDDIVLSSGNDIAVTAAHGVPFETEEEVIYTADFTTEYTGSKPIYPFVVKSNQGEVLVKVGVSDGKVTVNDIPVEGSSAAGVNKVKAVVCTAESRVEVFLNEKSVYQSTDLSAKWSGELTTELTEGNVALYLDNITAMASGKQLQEVTAPERDTIVFNEKKGWNLWLDEAQGLYEDSNCTWKNDKLYLPGELDFSKSDGVYTKEGQKLPVNEPTGGWGTLFDADGTAKLPEGKAKQITLPSTVEEQFGTGDVQWTYHGVSWFYRSVDIAADQMGKKALLKVENARQRTEIYVNGFLAGYDLIAETEYTADITPYLKEGKNQIAIRITNPGAGESSQYNGGNSRGWQDFYWTRWGEDATTGEGYLPPSHDFTGIGGDVSLTFTDKDLSISSVFVKNLEDPSYRKIEVQTNVENKNAAAKTANVEVAIFWHNTEAGKPEGRPVFRQVTNGASFASGEGTWTLPPQTITGADLWDIDHPNLYDCVVTLRDGDGNILDTVTTTFGFRVFQVKNGSNGQPDFFINGERVTVKSAIDWGYYANTGMYPTKKQAERSVANARALGLNSINQHRKIGSPRIMQEADEQGLYIYEEPGGFQAGYGPEGLDITCFPKASEYMLEKVKRMTIRDRNHPSLIIYNMCNESNGWLDNKGVPSALVPDAATKSTRAEAMMLVAQLDGTRLVQNTSGSEFTADADKDSIRHIKPYGEIPKDSNSFDTDLMDRHNAEGGVRFDERELTSFNQTASNTNKIVYHGEVRAFPAADNWFLSYESLSEVEEEFGDGRHGYDEVQNKGLHDKLADYYASHSFTENIKSPADLTKLAGNSRMYSAGRIAQHILSYNDVDGFAINGWSSQAPIDGWDAGYSGIVDEDRNIKGDPETMRYYTRPVQIAMFRLNGKYFAPGSSAQLRVTLLNDPSNPGGEAALPAGKYTFKVTVTDGAGKDVDFSYPAKSVTVQGGDVYAQDIETSLSIPTNATWQAGYITVTGTLYDSANRVVATGTEQFLLQNRRSYWGSIAPLDGAVYNWDGAARAISDAGSQAQEYDDSLTNLDYIAASGEAGDITGLLEKVKEGTTLLVNLNDSWAKALTDGGVLKEKPELEACTQIGSWSGNGFGYIDGWNGGMAQPTGSVVTLGGWEVPGVASLTNEKGSSGNPTGASAAFKNKVNSDTRAIGFAPFTSDYETKSYGAYFARKADPNASAWYGFSTEDDILRTLIGEISYGEGKILLAPAYPVDLNNAFSDMLFYNMLASSGDGTVLEPDYSLDATFFGRWDGGKWVSKGLLNYDYTVDGVKVLSKVEEAAKIGDYPAAKEALAQVSIPIELGSMTIAYQDGALTIESGDVEPNTDRDSAIPLYGAEVKTVTLNGEEIPFATEDGYIFAVGLVEDILLYDSFESGSTDMDGRTPEKGEGAWKRIYEKGVVPTCLISSDKGYGGNGRSILFESMNTSANIRYENLPSSGTYTISMQIYDSFVPNGIANFTINFNDDKSFVGITPSMSASSVWMCRPTGGSNTPLLTAQGGQIPRSEGWHLFEIQVKDGVGTVYIDGTETNFKEPINSLVLMQRSGWWNNQPKNNIYVDEVKITRERVVPATFALGEVDDSQATVVMTPNEAYGASITAYVALYQGEALLEVRKVENPQKEELLSFPLPQDKTGLKLKCMVWGGSTGNVPLMAPKTFSIAK